MNNQGLPINIFILPSKNKNNKYIELLINSFKNNNLNMQIFDLKKDTICYILYLICFKKIPKARNIIHIQWSTVLYGSRFVLKSTLMLFVNVIILLVAKKILKVKIVWTVHNFFAHDYPHPFIDKLGRKWLRTISDSIIVQQVSTLSDYINKYPSKNIRYVPPGNYIDAYGPIESRNNVFRRSFGFADNDLVLISLGAIAPYKLNENIIRSVIYLRKKFPRLKLLIVGKGKDEYIEKLRKMTMGDNGVIIKNLFVPDIEIPKYFSISDYSIFYYDTSEMTSGGIILSLSYGIPVLSRAIPGAEMVRGDSGFTFHNEEGLKIILVDILSRFENKTSDDIINIVRQFDWNLIATDLARIYRCI